MCGGEGSPGVWRGEFHWGGGESSTGVCGGEGSPGVCGGEGSPGVCGGEGSPGVCGREGSTGVCGGEGSPGVCGGEGSPGVCGGEGSPGVEGLLGGKEDNLNWTDISIHPRIHHIRIHTYCMCTQCIHTTHSVHTYLIECGPIMVLKGLRKIVDFPKKHTLQ